MVNRAASMRTLGFLSAGVGGTRPGRTLANSHILRGRVPPTPALRNSRA